MIILKKLGVAILSCFLFSIIWAALFSQPEQSNNPDAWTFDESFVLVFMVAIIIFLMGGIPSSIIIDGMMNNISFSKRAYKYMVHPVLYILAGLLLGSLLSLLLTQELDSFILYPSVVAALCFYFVSLCMGKLMEWIKEEQKT